MALEKAAIACRAQICHDGPAEAVLIELPTLADCDWLFRSVAGLSNAPVINDLALTARAYRYNHGIAQFWKNTDPAKASGRNIMNPEMFNIA